MAESDGSWRPEWRSWATRRFRRSCTLLLVALLVGSPLTATLVAADSPDFDATVPEPVVTPGETQELTVQLRNDAEGSGSTAENVRVEATDGSSGIEVLSGVRSLGTVPGGQSASVTVRIDVPADLDPGTYTLPVKVTFEEDGDTETQQIPVTVRVADDARFQVENVDSSVAVGDTGNVTISMTNVGTETASAAAVSLTSTSSEVTFGKAASASRFVGEWAPGETRNVTYEATVAGGASPLSYTLNAQVTYDDESGTTKQSPQFRVGVTPAAEQTFSVSDIESTMRVGEDGELRATVENTGPRAVEDVVVTLDPRSENVDAAETEIAVGDLEPGQSVSVAFDVSVSESAASGPRPFTLDVEYRNGAGELRQADSADVQAAIAPERSRFTVSRVSTNFSAGDAGTLTVNVTNVGDEPVTDLSAKLYTDAPLSSSDDEAFAETLESGETKTLTFSIAVGGDAIEKVYPAKLDFRYDTTDGETHISETYQVPVQVGEETGGGFEVSLPIVGIGLLVVLLVFGVAAYLRE